MRIGYCLLDGVPRHDNASARNLRALRWLNGRHDITLLPVYRRGRAHPSTDDAAADLIARVGAGAVLGTPLFEPPELTRVQRVLDVGTARRLGPELLAATTDFDWVWISYPPIAAAAATIAEFRRRGTRLSWDWDCLSLLNARAARQSGFNMRTVVFALRGMTCLHYERRRLARLDVLSVPGPVDAMQLRRTTGREVHVLRAAVDLSQFHEAFVSEAQEPHALFIGSRWGPNVHGIRWVLRNVWPEVSRRLPRARLRIVGRGMTADVLPDVPPNVDIVSDVEDVAVELAAARVVLCPIFYGAGIPTKLLEAGASGKATVTTTYCDRALGGSGFMVADDPTSWRDYLVRVLADPGLARARGVQGYEVVARNWSVQAWERDMSEVERAMIG